MAATGSMNTHGPHTGTLTRCTQPKISHSSWYFNKYQHHLHDILSVQQFWLQSEDDIWIMSTKLVPHVCFTLPSVGITLLYTTLHLVSVYVHWHKRPERATGVGTPQTHVVAHHYIQWVVQPSNLCVQSSSQPNESTDTALQSASFLMKGLQPLFKSQNQADQWFKSILPKDSYVWILFITTESIARTWWI